ncbi:hypothetical protein BJV74DRAFT_882217 [Russula compacta]|nr:hypothetical protein BJV74DRAFT_882217 [Russula compacta]
MSLGSFGYPPDSDEETTISSRSVVSCADYDKAQKKFQLEIGELKTALQVLREENATLKAVASKGRGRRARGDATSEADKQMALAKKYCLTVGPWLDRIHIKQPCPEIDPTSNDVFSTDEGIRVRMIKELYDYLPEKFHDQLQNVNAFGKLLKDGVDSQRSLSLNHARTLAPIIFQDLSLLGFDERKKKYSMWPPILYKDLKEDILGLFFNPILPNLYRGLIFGSKSLNGGSVSKAMNGTIGRLWGTTKITAGGIATTAVMLHFVFSSDVDFSRVGATSKIEYERDFNTYKRLLVTKWTTHQMKALQKFWNSIIFVRITPKDSRVEDSESSDDSEFDNILNAFDRMEVGGNNEDGVGAGVATLDHNNQEDIPCPEEDGPSTEPAAPPVVMVITTAVTVDVNTATITTQRPQRQTRTTVGDGGNLQDLDITTEATGRGRGRGRKAGMTARGSAGGRGRGSKGKQKATEVELE